MQLVINHAEVWLESYRSALLEAIGITADQLGMTEAAVQFLPAPRRPMGFSASTPSPDSSDAWVGHSSVRPVRLTLSVEEAAARLGLSKAATYEAVQRNEIPYVRIGRRVLIPVKALEAFLEGRWSPPGVRPEGSADKTRDQE